MSLSQTTTPSVATFAELNLAAPIMQAIVETGYTIPTPIQAKAIPLVLAGGDLLAAAQTGTGKTAGFTLPILHILSTSIDHHQRAGRPRCLILTPTRELAAQVEESVKTYGKHVPLKSMVMFGGVGINPQIQALKRRVDILVATPGRLLDHVGQKTVDLSGIEILVLDEADRMLDMGFIHDIKKVLALLPKKRQNLLFSATFSDEIKTLADKLLQNPGFVEVARRNTAAEAVTQSVHMVEARHKRDVLAHLIKTGAWEQVLVFTRTKHGANKLAEHLVKHGISSAAIHGNKSQSARTKALADFKASNVTVLVATDIAARGLDIDQLPQVVNFELPNVPEDYVHRIGRTGRAGASGAAVSLVDAEEVKLLKAIESLIRKPIERVHLQGFVPSPKAVVEVDDRPPLPPRGRPGQGRPGGGQPRQGQSRQPHGSNGNTRGQTTGGRGPQSQAPRAAAQPRTDNRQPAANPVSQGHPKPQTRSSATPAPRAALFTPKAR